MKTGSQTGKPETQERWEELDIEEGIMNLPGHSLSLTTFVNYILCLFAVWIFVCFCPTYFLPSFSYYSFFRK